MAMNKLQIPYINHSAEETMPPRVLNTVVSSLVEQYGCRPSQAEAMVKTAAEAYGQCCARNIDLQPGQVVWLAYSTERSRRRHVGKLRPIVLILNASTDNHNLQHRGHLKQLKMKQIERMAAEAWMQDAVLTLLDLEWLLNVSPSMIRQLLDA